MKRKVVEVLIKLLWYFADDISECYEELKDVYNEDKMPDKSRKQNQ